MCRLLYRICNIVSIRVIFTLIILTGCALIPQMRYWLNKVSITAEDKINKNRIIVCHIVACCSEDSSTAIGSLKANEYFTQYKALQKKYKNDMQMMLKVNVKPGTSKRNIKITSKVYAKIKGLYFFARYISSEGEYEAKLGTERVMNIYLGESAIEVKAEQKKKLFDFGFLKKS